MLKLTVGFIFLLNTLIGSAFDEQTIDAVLEQTIDRQEQALQSQLTNRYPASGMWRHENFALAAYWLNTSNAVADAELIACETNGLYQSEINAEHFHWHAYLLERIYFLFSSQSDFFPGRMSTNAENAILRMLWNWAAPRCQIGMANTNKIYWSWGSENHHAQAWVSFWGAAQIFKQHPDYKNLTYNDGSTPALMAEKFNDYFRAYTRERISKGMTVETASPTYAKYTLNTWYNLADFAKNSELKKNAGMLLDLYWADWAVEQIDGVRGGSRHRSYSGASSIRDSADPGLAWYHFGIGSPSNKHPGRVSAATTLWRPSRATVGLALDVEGRGEYAYVSRRLGRRDASPPSEPPALSPHAYNALNPAGGSLLRYTWCTPDFIMGMSQVEALGWEEWVNFSSQNRWNGVIFGGHDTARIFTHRPYPGGGNSVLNDEWGVQHKGAMILQCLTGARRANGQMVWFDFSLNRIESNGWVFAQAPRAYAAVRVVEGGWSWQPDSTNLQREICSTNIGEWLVLSNKYSPIIIEVASTNEYANFASFRNDILDNTLTVAPQRVDYISSRYDVTLTLFSDESAPPRVNGVPLDFSPAKAYDGPHIQGDFGKGHVVISYGTNRTVIAEKGVTAVDFGGDYRDANQNATAALTFGTGDYDFDGASDDRRGYRNIDSFFMTVTVTNDVGIKNNRFNAGVQAANFDSSADPGISLYRYSGSSDALQVTSASGTAKMGLAFAPHVIKADFLNGTDTAVNLRFEDAPGSVFFNIHQFASGQTARALVKNGLNWYVSSNQLISTGSLSLNGYTETWYVYNPSNNLFLDTANPGAGVLGSTLTNIQAYGVFMQGLNFNGTTANAANFQVSGFQASVVPENGP